MKNRTIFLIFSLILIFAETGFCSEAEESIEAMTVAQPEKSGVAAEVEGAAETEAAKAEESTEKENISFLDYAKVTELDEESYGIEITANKKNVNVFINGIFHGKTPLNISGLTPGIYFLRGEKEGFKTLNYMVEVTKGYKLTYYLKFKENK